jgi:hypothetical protein
MADDDVLSYVDEILADADTNVDPWATRPDGHRVFQPDYDLARQLLHVPISHGYATKQQSGRVAKALDAWIAHELRRAGFPEDAVWPRRKRPRTLPADLGPVEGAIDDALARLDEFEERLEAFGAGRRPPSLRRVRPAIERIRAALPGSANADILGRFYVKQVDVVVSSWQRGPDVLVSSKTQFSSYLNNKNNRYEEAVGEATNLRDRHPMAAMGFVYLVRTNLFDEQGAFVYLRNQLARLRKPDGPFDATMLLAGDWSDGPVPSLRKVDDADDLLSAPRFFGDLLGALMDSSPVDLHQEVRLRHQGESPEGGMPPMDYGAVPDESETESTEASD